MSCRAKGRYSINGYVFPQPEASPWERVSNGQQLTTNLPIYSPYRHHRWRFPALPDDPYSLRLDTLEGTALMSLITNPPTDADGFTEYTEAKILSVTRTPAWGSPRSIEVLFEVFVG